MSHINKNEPNTGPQPDRWYDLSLGSSFRDPSSKFCTLRYEFKPASIDKNQAGTLHKTKDNKITVEFRNNQQGKPNVTFEGSSEDYKENDAVLFFDGVSFRLERLHRAVKRLRHVRLPGESASAAATTVAGPSAGPTADAGGSPQIGKVTKLPFNKSTVPAIPVEVERIDIGDFKGSGSDAKPQNEKVVDYSSIQENASNASPDKMDDLDEQLDILNDDDDDVDIDIANGGSNDVKEYHTGIDINIPHQNDTDDEIADVDASDDEADKGRNAAEALRAQVNAEEKEQQTSSSSGSSGSESSGSGSASGSGSGSGSSSSDSENSDDDSVNSI